MSARVSVRPDHDRPEDHRRHSTLAESRAAMQATRSWSVHQQMGRRWPIGCVALEISQRCNLDCTICYLSEHSEAVKDIPLAEVCRRIDRIYEYYGPRTDIQVTGGDPTLRQRDEPVAIIHRIHAKGMRSTLMTNGILAIRSLLEELASAGLNDVAFHVDMTQERKGYRNEIELNRIREKYIKRAQGLGLLIMFNTTMYRENFHEIPYLVRFIRQHARHLRLVSFQLQADTGRGVERERAALITPDTVWRQIESETKTNINFNAIRTGHSDCNRYGMALIVNNRFYDLFDEPEFIGEMVAATADVTADRKQPWKTAACFLGWLIKHPRYISPLSKWGLRKFSAIKNDLLLARGDITTLSFFVHNFMDARQLDPERIQACAFKVMTPEGPVSMCEYNARRDEYILKPLAVSDKEHTVTFWNPLTGDSSPAPVMTHPVSPEDYPLKKLKGRTRQQALQSAR